MNRTIEYLEQMYQTLRAEFQTARFDIVGRQICGVPLGPFKRELKNMIADRRSALVSLQCAVVPLDTFFEDAAPAPAPDSPASSAAAVGATKGSHGINEECEEEESSTSIPSAFSSGSKCVDLVRVLVW